MGYYAEDDRYGSIGQLQDRNTPRQKNWMVQNPKSDGLISLKKTETLGQPHKQWVWKSEVAQSLGGSQGQTGPRGGTLINDEVERSTEMGLVEVAAEQSKAQCEKTKIRAEAGTSSLQQPNWIVRIQDKRGSRGLPHPGWH
jgi:hypothetical protein